MSKRHGGDVLAGRYRLVAELGRGGMGEVWRAEHLALRSAVAVKLLARALVETPEAAARFEREARASAALRSPHVVQILDHGVDGDTPFIVMELLDGETLAARLRREIRLSPAEALRILTHIARALTRAHDLSIVHRDLKPDNIFLVQNDDETVAKLLDFGIAKVDDAEPGASPLRTGSGVLMGTPLYMSPEQARGAPVDARSDLWSLAVIAFECLCGRPPYAGDSMLDVLVAITMKPAPVPSAFAPTPAGFDAWFARAANRDPSLRFPSAKEMIEALRAALEGEPRHVLRTPSEPPDPRARGEQETLAAPTPAPGGLVHTAAPVVVRTRSEPPDPRARGEQETLAAPTPAPTPGSLAQALATVGPRRRSRAAAIAGLLAALAIGGGVYAIVRPSPRQAPASPPPLSPATSVLACPILKASGVEGDGGWLGAAAATVACERARVILGGAGGRTLIPAELLDLPRQPVETFPAEPYGTADARARSMAAASRRAAAILDGSVAREGDDFDVTLVLRRPNGDELARGSARARTVHGAVRRAMDPLVAPGLLARAPALDDAYATWFGVTTVDDALLAIDGVLMSTSADSAEVCADAATRDAAPGTAWGELRWNCAYMLGQDAPSFATPPLDRASAPRLYRTALDRYVFAPSTITKGVAEELRARFDREAWPCGRALLAALESNYWQGVGDDGKAHNAGLLSVQSDPRCYGVINVGWWQVAITSDAHAVPVARGYVAWRPYDPQAWLRMAAIGGEGGLAYATRANVLAPRQPLSTSVLFDLLLGLGRREEARALAVRLESGDLTQRAASVLMLLRLEAADARVAAAHGRALAAVRDLAKAGGYGLSQRIEIATRALALSLVLGRGAETADGLVKDIVDPEPPRLETQDPLTGARLAAICGLAHRATAAACFSRLHELAKRGFLSGSAPGTDALIEGAEAYARGDRAAAARRWRPLMRSPDAGVELLAFALADAFDAEQEPELAEKVDAPLIARGGAYNGADLAFVRAARRAAARGDPARARDLARKIVDAWSVADETIPSVAEMKKLLAKLR